MTERFRLIFAGEVLPEHRPEDVQRQLGALLRVSPARQAALFSGRPTVLRRGMSFDDAGRYAARFERLGARVRIEPDGRPARRGSRAPNAALDVPAGADPATVRQAAEADVARVSRRRVVTATVAAAALAGLAVGVAVLGGGASPFAPRVPDARLARLGLTDAARAEFRAAYAPAGGNKAFAASPGGAFAHVAGAPTDQDAAQQALAACDGGRAPGAPACRLVDLTGSLASVTP